MKEQLKNKRTKKWKGKFSISITRKWEKAYDTRDSQDVSVPSTNRARCCLTSQIGRDGVLSAGYGRKRVAMDGTDWRENRCCLFLAKGRKFWTKYEEI